MMVLDASALVELVIGQPTRSWVLDHVRGKQVAAPSHQPAEVLSAVARLARAGALTPDGAVGAVRDAAVLHQELVMPTAEHLTRAVQMQDRVRVLDALYVVLAQDRGADLVTTDRRLARADLPVTVIAPPDGITSR